MENYHGTGAFNLTKWNTWDSILDDMLNQPKSCVIVQAKRRGRGHGGWSANNPYLEEVRTFVDWTDVLLLVFHTQIHPK